MAVPTRTNLSHYRGDSLSLQFTVWADAAHTEPADLSEATVRAQLRTDPDATEVVAAFDITVEGHVITAHLSPKNARDLPPKCVYDVEVDWYGTDTSVQTIAAGQLVVQPDVTRDGVT